VLADAFQIDLDRIRVTPTTTGKVPNTSATAASSGTDLNAMAAADAARQIKERLQAFGAERWQTSLRTCASSRTTSWWTTAHPLPRVRPARLSGAGAAFGGRVLQDSEDPLGPIRGRGRPFYYYAYGAAVSEVSVDTLTGENQVDRVDILHDVGRSLNPAIDIGQIEGGFVQGMGWLTTEELWWDAQGRLRTHAPSTYKIPLASDRPRASRALGEWSENPEPAVGRPRPSAEPPLMLAISCWRRCRWRRRSSRTTAIAPAWTRPPRPSACLMTIERLRAAAEAGMVD
jgi:xanthine dehydrogenase large subunit